MAWILGALRRFRPLFVARSVGFCGHAIKVFVVSMNRARDACAPPSSAIDSAYISPLLLSSAPSKELIQGWN